MKTIARYVQRMTLVVAAVCVGLNVWAVQAQQLPASVKTPTANPCPEADGVTKVDGKLECLVIQTTPRTTLNATPDKAKLEAKKGQVSQLSKHYKANQPIVTLLIYLHGDSSRGGLYDRHFKHFAAFANLTNAAHRIVFVGMIRPGYADSHKNASSGSTLGGGDNYTAHNVDAVANAIGALKNKYSARRVVVVGYSGGAATAGVILGRHPELIDDAVLIACPCDLTVRRMGMKNQNRRSISPHEVADQVFKTVHVTAITGAKDSNTKPKQVTGYIQSLQQRGVKARYIELADATHETGILGTTPLRQVVQSHVVRK